MTCSTKNVSNSSLEPDHVYSLMDVDEFMRPGHGKTRLLKIRNPHTKSKWAGDWSDSSPLWTPQLRRRLGCPEGGTAQVFFMSLDDFLREFVHCTICRVRPREWHEAQETLKLPHGVAPGTAIMIDVAKATECTLSLVQPGERLRGGPFYPHLQEPLACIGFVVVGVDGEGQVLADAPMSRRGRVFTDCWLDPGRYALVPLSLHTGASLTMNFACQSSNPVTLARQELKLDDVKRAWGAYARHVSGGGIKFHGAELHLGKSEGGCVVAYAENLVAEAEMHLHVELGFKSNCLEFSRFRDATSDWLEPGEAQIITVAQPPDADVQVRWHSSHKFNLTNQAPTERRHEPPLGPGDHLHKPFRPARRERNGSCAVQ